MSSAAKLNRFRMDADHPHPISVLLAEESDRSGLLGLDQVHRSRGGFGVVADPVIDQILDAVELLQSRSGEMGVVEAQIVGSNHRPGLLHVVPQDPLERFVEQVGGRMVRADGFAALRIDGELVNIPHPESTGLDPGPVDDQRGNRSLCVENSGHGLATGAGDLTGIADLAPGFPIEGSAVKHQLDRFSGSRFGSLDSALPQDRPQGPFAFVSLPLVTQEFRLAEAGRQAVVGVSHTLVPRTGEVASLSLLGHPCFVGRLVDIVSPLSGDDLSEIPGKPVGVVQKEDQLSSQYPAPLFLQPLHLFVDQPQPAIQRPPECLFFEARHFEHEGTIFAKLRIRLGHHPDHLLHDFGQEERVQPESGAVTDGPPHDPPQHVTPAFVGGLNPVGYQERGGPGMVGDHPHRGVVDIAAAVALV